MTTVLKRHGVGAWACAAFCFALSIAPGDGAAGVASLDVSARKRTEAAAAVPLSMTIIESQDIRRLNVSDLADIVALTPGLHYDEAASPADIRVSVRGVSSAVDRPAFALVVDGVDVSSAALRSGGGSLLINPRLFDLERVEVIKGPQGALYGRNAMNGVIQLVTRDPSERFSAELIGDGGNYGRAEAEASVSGPLVTDRLGVRISGLFWNEHGAYENAVTSNDIHGGQGWAGAVTLKYTPTRALSFRARISYADDEYKPAAQTPVEANRILAAPSLALADNDPVTAGTQSVVAVNPGLDGAAGPDPRNGLPLFSDTLSPVFVGNVPDAGYVVRMSPNFLRSGGELSARGELPGSDRQEFRATLAVDWDVGIGTLRSRTHYADADVANFSDHDKRAVGFAFTSMKDETALHSFLRFDNETTLYSQDLSFASDWSHPFQMTVGALRWVEDVDQSDRGGTLIAQGARCVLPGDCPGFTATPAYLFVDDFLAAQAVKPTRRDIRHWSGYAVLDVDLNDLGIAPTSKGAWRLRAEGRYTRETQRLAGPTPTGFGSPEDFLLCGPNQSCDALVVPASFVAPALVATADAPLGYVLTRFKRREDYFSPRITVEWQPNDDRLFYFSFAASRRPGGFASLGISNAGLDPNKNGLADETELQRERLNVYEIGAKTTWLGGKLQLNAAAFHQSLDDKQVMSTAVIGDVLTPVFSNAGKAKVFGVELDAHWQPTTRWSFHAGYSFLSAKYDDFEVATSDPVAIAAAGCGRVVPYATVDSTGSTVDTFQCVVDYSDKKVESTPNHALVGTAEYTAPLFGSLEWFAGTTLRYQGRRYLSPDNLAKLKPYAEVDVRLGVKGDHWEFLVYGDNVFDNDKVKSAYVADDVGGPSVYRTGMSATESVAYAKLVDGVFANQPTSWQYGARARFHF